MSASEGHPELANPPGTEAATMAKKAENFFIFRGKYLKNVKSNYILAQNVLPI